MVLITHYEIHGYALGLTKPTDFCKAGYHCITRNTVPNPNEDLVGKPCEPGYYCPRGQAHKECPAGTYSSNTST